MKNIEEALGSQSQKAVARLVGSLPEDTPSMVWRSALNEKLALECGRVQRRRRFFFLARPALGLALACALGVLVYVRPAPIADVHPRGNSHAVTQTKSDAVEAALVNLHLDDLRAMDVAGAGLNPNDSTPDTSGSVSSTDDSQADLEL